MLDRLLTETERQQKYLDRLPKDYTFPLFNAKQALLSQRASSYRDTASAAREIVDNAMEAGATRIDIVMEEGRQGYYRGSISAIAFIDNGAGMKPKMAQYALSWGGGSHFDDPSFIGRFGFGLPNASISQSRRTEVYTRTVGQNGFTKAWLDIDDYDEFEKQTIPQPEENAELPDFVVSYLRRNKIEIEHGTVVVWVSPDKISSRRVGTLKEKLIDDFGVTYRYLLPSKLNEDLKNPLSAGQVELVIQGVSVAPVDPLFLSKGGRYFVPENKDGAIQVYDRDIPVCLMRNPQTGEQNLQLANPSDFANPGYKPSDDEVGSSNPRDYEQIIKGIIHVQVARFPFGFSVGKPPREKDLSDSNKRFEIRRSRRGISFVRAKREIETSDRFPRQPKDSSSGLGEWPQQTMYALNWAAEVRFSPELDDVFGITHDKQSVRPVDDFWRVMAQAGVDDVLRAQQAKLQQEERARRDADAKKAVTVKQGPSAAEIASKNAVMDEGVSGPRVPTYYRPTLNQRFEAGVALQAAETNRPLGIVRQEFETEVKARPFVLDFVDDRHAPFYEPEWSDKSQVVVKINRQHPFFSELYADLATMSGGNKVKQVVDLLLITLARAELECETKDMYEWYVTQREERWSTFLKRAINNLRLLHDAVETQGGN